MYKGEERRKYKRVKTEVQVDVEKYESSPMLLSTTDSTSKNVSIGGVLIKFKKPLEINSLILNGSLLSGGI